MGTRTTEGLRLRSWYKTFMCSRFVRVVVCRLNDVMSNKEIKYRLLLLSNTDSCRRVTESVCLRQVCVKSGNQGFGMQTSVLGTRNPAKDQNPIFAVHRIRRLTANTIFTNLKINDHQLKFTTSIEKGKLTNKKSKQLKVAVGTVLHVLVKNSRGSNMELLYLVTG